MVRRHGRRTLNWTLAALTASLLALGCSDSSPEAHEPDAAVSVEPGPDAGFEAGADAGGPPAPACDPTMDWKPRTFSGPTFYVDSVATGPGTGTSTDPWKDLQHAIDEAPDGAVLMVRSGVYSATATDYTDPTCGNCAPDKQKSVPATRGFLITGKSLAIRGTGGLPVIKTNAGYGILIEDACEVYVSGVIVTAGARDPDGAAADGAVVVRRSRATLENVSIINNTALLPNNGYPGIAGLMLRQGADVVVMNSTINNNSWDGVTIFDDGKLRMYGSKVNKGNGVGVGATWSGRALLVNNEISNYWKGIGAFVDAQVEARNNRVHHNVGWGVWVNQNARMDLINNTIAYNDLVGASLDGATVKGTFVNNVVAYNGLWKMKSYPEDTFGGRIGVRGAAPTEQGPIAPSYNVVFGNQTKEWVLSDGTTLVDLTKLGTNRVADPKFGGEFDYTPGAGSALLDSGDPELRDADGSRSDVGATGGVFAGVTGP